MKLQPFVVVVEDTVIQIRDYVVMAFSDSDAKERVQEGQFMTESSPETIETISSFFVSSTPIDGIDSEEI